ncbi:MAG: copper amine oxidase N-terminal domain-containing protein [Clostridia bacterium]|nr:copper amine oxidase N-terminal domain-containing protein [Clostridia bacterium]
MKKIVSIMLVLCMVFSITTAFAANTEIIINGEKATIAEGMGSIVEKDNRTFVPVRFLMEYFGFEVTWENETQSVLGRHENGESFCMQVGNTRLFYFDANGNKKDLKPMDTTPFLNYSEGRTYVPLRFLAEAIGYTVGWDGETETVTLTLAK